VRLSGPRALGIQPLGKTKVLEAEFFLASFLGLIMALRIASRSAQSLLEHRIEFQLSRLPVGTLSMAEPNLNSMLCLDKALVA
jgi:hypothetical protein